MSDNEQNNYALLYAQRQEQLLFEQIRKTIDAEIKALIATKSSNDFQLKYEESQKNVAVQNDMMMQAKNSIEDLTVKNKNHEQKVSQLNESITNLNNRVNQLQNDLNNANKLKDEAANETSIIQNSIDQYKREIDRLNQENQTLYKENEEFKININKKITPSKKKEENIF